MKMITSIIGGLSGAVALNILHETVRRFDQAAPRVDLVGEEALQKSMKGLGAEPLTGYKLYAATLAGDLMSNALYYSLLGSGSAKYLPIRGMIHGAIAGIGALKLTKPMGLNDAPVNRTEKTQVLTVAYYAFGGLIAALTMRRLSKN
jgi:hypothetical protein